MELFIHVCKMHVWMMNKCISRTHHFLVRVRETEGFRGSEPFTIVCQLTISFGDQVQFILFSYFRNNFTFWIFYHLTEWCFKSPVSFEQYSYLHAVGILCEGMVTGDKCYFVIYSKHKLEFSIVWNSAQYRDWEA